MKNNLYGTLASLVYWGLFAIFALLLGFQFAYRHHAVRVPAKTGQVISRNTGLDELHKKVRQIVKRTSGLGRFGMQKNIGLR